jgi:hypothetical protein
MSCRVLIETKVNFFWATFSVDIPYKIMLNSINTLEKVKIIPLLNDVIKHTAMKGYWRVEV